MSSKYVVVNTGTDTVGSFDTYHEAVDFAKRDAAKIMCNRYVYALVADVVVETRTVVEVIEHEHS